MSNGIVLVLSAPSGAGKSTLCQALVDRRADVRLSVSCTTRGPRPLEVDGQDYFFVSEPAFKTKIQQKELLEWAEVHGNYYGTPKAPIEAHLSEGLNVVMDIDTQGAQSVRKVFPESVLVFIAPPSWKVLEERLRGRNQDDETTIQRRLANARAEMEQAAHYDYLVTNDHIEDALEDLLAILRAEQRRVPRLGLQESGWAPTL
ncbi:MAG: guanylate kinase [Elusimicrobia bacterium]|jgi:guanylate kinase|nr:guanylate kinase [Elusimicrobiota bacterium]